MPTDTQPARTAPPRLRLGLSALLIVAVTATTVGCGGSSSSGIASKSASEILAASEAAARKASSVHVSGVTGKTVGLKLDLSRAGGSAQVALGGNTFELIRIGQTLYVKGPTALYRQLGVQRSVPADTWLKAQAGGAGIGRLASFTQLERQVSGLMEPSKAVKKGSTKTFSGQKVVELTQRAGVYSTTLYVAATGTPYPLHVVLRGQADGQSTYSKWNKPVSVTPPSKVFAVR